MAQSGTVRKRGTRDLQKGSENKNSVQSLFKKLTAIHITTGIFIHFIYIFTNGDKRGEKRLLQMKCIQVSGLNVFICRKGKQLKFSVGGSRKCGTRCEV